MNSATRKKTLRLLSNGVYILTSRNDNRYGAATVTWLSQISFKPPLIMAAVRTGSNVFQCMQESCVATIHILGSDQEEIAQKFFSQLSPREASLTGSRSWRERLLLPFYKMCLFMRNAELNKS